MGAFYVREADGPLRRTASFGFDPDSASVPQTLAGPDSLVGQTVRARKLTHVAQVPSTRCHPLIGR